MRELGDQTQFAAHISMPNSHSVCGVYVWGGGKVHQILDAVKPFMGTSNTSFIFWKCHFVLKLQHFESQNSIKFRTFWSV